MNNNIQEKILEVLEGCGERGLTTYQISKRVSKELNGVSWSTIKVHLLILAGRGKVNYREEERLFGKAIYWSLKR